MIEELYIFLIIFVLSLVFSHFLMSAKAGPWHWFSYRAFFLGLYFHEGSHYLMSLLVGIKPEYIKVRWRDERFGFRNPYGLVMPSRQPTFLQALVSAVAPLVFSTWLIFGLWFGVVFNPSFFFINDGYTIFIRVISGFLIVSLFMTAAPSVGDLRAISAAFRENPSHSWYQILLVSISIGILWIILLFTQIFFFLDIFYYLAIAGIYLSLKFSLIGIKKLFIHLSTRNYTKPSKVKMRPLTHKRYKPQKPPKRV